MSRVEKKPKPFGVCEACGAITDQRGDINQRCRKAVHGRRCSGLFKSGVGLGGTWRECPSCTGAGKTGGRPCVECSGFGWHYSR